MTRVKMLFVMVVSALLWLACEDDAEVETSSDQTVAVKATIVESSNEDAVKVYTGTLEGKKQAVIRSKIAEAVEEVYVREGSTVTAGQVIIALDRAGTTSSFQQTLSLYRNAEKHFNKMAYLYEEGAVSESDYDAARTDYEVQKAAYEAAKQLVDISTPIAGTVTSITVSRGDYVDPGQELATVAAVDSLRVRFGVNSADVYLVTEGDPVGVSVDAVGRSVSGRVTSVARSADPFTRAYQVEAMLDNAAGDFTPGMFATIGLVLDRYEQVLAVPRGAVLELGGRHLVYVVVDGKAVQRAVTLGPDLDGRVVITSGLAAGDTLVTLGQDYLDDGVAVNMTSLESGE